MPTIISVNASAIYISIIALLALFLAYRVVQFRLGKGVDIGDDGSAEFQTAIRVHANLVEWAPITLLLLLVSELLGANNYFLHVAGIAFVVARIAHAYGMTIAVGGGNKGRFYGTLVSWIVLIVLAVSNVLMVAGVF
jgi:uncharacterized membrane protein YecN with MAPEG domain